MSSDYNTFEMSYNTATANMAAYLKAIPNHYASLPNALGLGHHGLIQPGLGYASGKKIYPKLTLTEKYLK